MSLDELRALEQAAKKALLGAILTKYDGVTKTWRRATLASDAFEDVERAVAALDGLLGRVEAAEAERDALAKQLDEALSANHDGGYVIIGLQSERDAYREALAALVEDVDDAYGPGGDGPALAGARAVLAASVPSGPAAAGPTTSKEPR